MSAGRPVRVAVLAERLGTSAGGPEVYERCLLTALHELSRTAEDVEILPVLAWRRALDFLPIGMLPSCRLLRPEGKLGTALVSGWHIRRLQADVVHCCFVVPPFLGDVPVLATVHDLGFVRIPSHYPPLLAFRLVKALHYAVRRADLLATVSESTRQDLLSLTGVAPEKVVTIHNGIDERFVPDPGSLGPSAGLERYGIREPYVLYAGKLEPRKNVPVLVEAYDRLRSSGRFGGQLVLMGSRRTFLWQEAQRRIDRSPFRRDIVQTGYAADADVPAIYARARALAFVSLYEGFGFPVLEAMASGVPVLCSDTTCLPEIAGDAALFAEPGDPGAIADGLARLVDEHGPRRELIGKGYLRVARFTWRGAAARFLDAYRSLAAKPGESRHGGNRKGN